MRPMRRGPTSRPFDSGCAPPGRLLPNLGILRTFDVRRCFKKLPALDSILTQSAGVSTLATPILYYSLPSRG